MALFNKNKDNEKPIELPTVSAEEVKTQIEQNCYLESDDIETMFGKYEALCNLDMENLNKAQKEKVHIAKLLFVNSIKLPKEDKEGLLNFIAHSLLYVRTSASQDALKLASKVGFTALKTVSVAGKIATLGMGSKVLNNVEKVANKAMTTDALELVNAWTIKIDSAFAAAKKLEGSFLNKDKDFAARLNDLKKQYENA
ncbi:MAG: hypothetical protein IKK36_03635 [Bacteroidales bacterium]|nr:hypothetical protein [Bacteroidales bacterium]